MNRFQLLTESGEVFEAESEFNLTEMKESYEGMPFDINDGEQSWTVIVTAIRQIAPYPVGECGIGRRARSTH